MSSLTLLGALAVCSAVSCSRAESSLDRVRSSAAPASTLKSVRSGAGAAQPSAVGLSTAAAPTGSPSAELTAGERLPPEERTWTFATTAVGRMSVVVLLPERARGARFPVLITMHGRGEALKGPERGARGWVEDYELAARLRDLAEPPLARDDFKSFVTAARLELLNAALAQRPYRGLVIVCPYTPDMLAGENPLAKAEPLARFLVDELLPRVYRETPALGTAATTGIDGVSLGGRAAWSVGLLRPEAFGAVAGLQAAFDVKDAPGLAERAREAKLTNPALTLRLLTSEHDYFLAADRAIAQAVRAAGVPVHFSVAQGPHDYAFNQGPGALEMLLFHDRVLRGEAPL